MIPKLDEGAAIAAVGLAVVQTITLYQNNAPSLRDLRAAPDGDTECAQLLLDADLMALIAVLAMGGAGAVLLRKFYPLLLGGAALLAVAAWHHAVYNSSNVLMRRQEKESKDNG